MQITTLRLVHSSLILKQLLNNSEFQMFNYLECPGTGHTCVVPDTAPNLHILMSGQQVL